MRKFVLLTGKVNVGKKLKSNLEKKKVYLLTTKVVSIRNFIFHSWDFLLHKSNILKKKLITYIETEFKKKKKYWQNISRPDRRNLNDKYL